MTLYHINAGSKSVEYIINRKTEQNHQENLQKFLQKKVVQLVVVGIKKTRVSPVLCIKHSGKMSMVS
jgi:phosphoribosylamine-glycine ligase